MLALQGPFTASAVAKHFQIEASLKSVVFNKFVIVYDIEAITGESLSSWKRGHANM